MIGNLLVGNHDSDTEESEVNLLSYLRSELGSHRMHLCVAFSLIHNRIFKVQDTIFSFP